MSFASRPENRKLVCPKQTADLTGQRFGKLVVLSMAGYTNASRYWLCRCDCGIEVMRPKSTLLQSRKRGGTCACDACNPRAPKLPDQAPRAKPNARCKHGFALPERDCVICQRGACALCGAVGHVSKLCPETEAGTRGLAERGAEA